MLSMSAANCEGVVTKDFVFGTVCDSVSFLWNNLNCHFQELSKGDGSTVYKKICTGSRKLLYSCKLYNVSEKKTSLLVFRAKALLILVLVNCLQP